MSPTYSHLLFALIVTLLWLSATAATAAIESRRRPYRRGTLIGTYVFIAGLIATLVSWLALFLLTIGVS